MYTHILYNRCWLSIGIISLYFYLRSFWNKNELYIWIPAIETTPTMEALPWKIQVNRCNFVKDESSLISFIFMPLVSSIEDPHPRWKVASVIEVHHGEYMHMWLNKTYLPDWRRGIYSYIHIRIFIKQASPRSWSLCCDIFATSANCIARSHSRDCNYGRNLPPPVSFLSISLFHTDYSSFFSSFLFLFLYTCRYALRDACVLCVRAMLYT